MKFSLQALKGRAGVVALAFVISSGPLATAQEEVDEAALAAAVELVEAADMDQIFDTVLPLFGDQIVQLVLQIKPELKGKFEPLVDEFLKTALTEGRVEFMQEMAKLYARRLSVPEMNDITAFYRTETGRKLVSVMPALQVEAAAIGTAWGEKIALKTFDRLRAKLKEDGHEF